MPRAEVESLAAPDVIRAVHGRVVQVLQTCGDGARSVRAGFGESVKGEFRKANPRASLRKVFGASVEQFVGRVGDPDLVNKLKPVLWQS